MAQPTTTNQATTAPHQAPTPGVGATPGTVTGMQPAPMHSMAQTPTTAPAQPVLFEDIDPVLLMRLYPHGKDARADAMAAGHAAHDAGLKLRAAAQEPAEGAA